ncbi:MAG: transcription antitermination factor NusB [Magnetococcales bacterium]|nr:transcription antitermination factor NusB [Magnetococcales bacterium]
MANEGATPARRHHGARHKAREMILQAFYQCDISGENMERAVEQIAEDQAEGYGDMEYFRHIAVAAWRRLAEIDPWIAKGADNWAPERISVVDRNILRLGVYELLATDLPIQVVINEAVELSKRFGTEDSGRFINGVMDRIAGWLRVKGIRGPGQRDNPPQD